METQNQIKRTLAQPEAIEHICSILNTNINIKRTKLADQLCDQFDFFDPRGKKQRRGCLKTLRELEQKGQFVLPPPSVAPQQSPILRAGHEQDNTYPYKIAKRLIKEHRMSPSLSWTI